MHYINSLNEPNLSHYPVLPFTLSCSSCHTFFILIIGFLVIFAKMFILAIQKVLQKWLYSRLSLVYAAQELDSTEIRVSRNQFDKKLRDLEPKTRYVIYVLGLTSSGRGTLNYIEEETREPTGLLQKTSLPNLHRR